MAKVCGLNGIESEECYNAAVTDKMYSRKFDG